MALLSAHQDLALRTLSRLKGPWEGLTYLAGTMDKGGEYYHWGLFQTHGVESATEALAAAHLQSWLDVLRSPIKDLVDPDDRFQADARSITSLPPKDYGGGSLRHFKAVAFALSAIARQRNRSQAA